AAVVKTESDFRPRLVSHANAHGLMQIIPSTGRLMGARDLFNPHDNIRTGTKYLRYLYDIYEGDRTMTLAAYNAGLGNVQKYGGVPPFRETQNYVVRVARSNKEYERRIRESAAKWSRLALKIRE
ncbi:MAG: lytic transglycosylase domain-containing protein, partial [Thermoanaerobaculia bacterium]|nr:lytic transglycosylase domain-containing protein [Thermoanaerobaculia bacterium]